jgi:hypothetical protein
LNVRDECDLPEDDGYDLFTRETEVERRRKDEPAIRHQAPRLRWRLRMGELFQPSPRVQVIG